MLLPSHLNGKKPSISFFAVQVAEKKHGGGTFWDKDKYIYIYILPSQRQKEFDRRTENTLP